MGKHQVLSRLSTERLLDLRLCDLNLSIEGTPLEACINQLYKELEDRNLTFHPHYWLSDEWFAADGIPGIAIPFYLAHSRLEALEQSQMLEVEGGTFEACMKLLRHETAHAIDNAYYLRRRKRRQKLFGNASRPYKKNYLPKPYSKRYVQHLDGFYAQSHPDEDFSETFAVWLDPTSDWKKRYQGWPALKKLNYVEYLMREISHKPPLVSSCEEIDPVSDIQKTLREHYHDRRKYFGIDASMDFDQDLYQMFSGDSACNGHIPADKFIMLTKKELKQRVSSLTGTYQYTVDKFLDEITHRVSELKLTLKNDVDQTKEDFLLFLTVQTKNYVNNGYHHYIL